VQHTGTHGYDLYAFPGGVSVSYARRQGSGYPDECTYATNREHDAPASPRDEQCADKRAERQTGYHGTVRMPPQRPRAWGGKNSAIAA